jgi:hypothetical protein
MSVNVKIPKTLPKPFRSKLIVGTTEWKLICQRIDSGSSPLEFELPLSMPNIEHPCTSFTAALQRKYRKSHHVYARKGIIYVVKL